MTSRPTHRWRPGRKLACAVTSTIRRVPSGRSTSMVPASSPRATSSRASGSSTPRSTSGTSSRAEAPISSVRGLPTSSAAAPFASTHRSVSSMITIASRVPFEDGPELPLAVAELLLHLPALRRIEQVALRVEAVALLVADDHVLVLHPDDPSVSRDQPVLLAVRPVVLGPRALDDLGVVVRVDELPEHVRVGEPLVGRVAERPLDLRAHVQARGRVVQVVDVHGEGQVLDERAVAGLRLAPGRVRLAPLDRRAEDPRRSAQRLDLRARPLTLARARVEADEAPGAAVGRDRNLEEGLDPLSLEEPARRLGKGPRVCLVGEVGLHRLPPVLLPRQRHRDGPQLGVVSV